MKSDIQKISAPKIKIPNIKGLLDSMLESNQSSFASVTNPILTTSINTNKLLVDSKQQVNHYYLHGGNRDEYDESYDNTIAYTIHYSLSNPYDQSLMFDPGSNDKRQIIDVYEQNYAYELMNSMRPSFSLQVAYSLDNGEDTAKLHIVTTMNRFIESIYSMLAKEIHHQLSLTTDDTISLYKIYHNKTNRNVNPLSFIPHYVFPIEIECYNKAHDIPSRVKICIAPTIKKIAMYVITYNIVNWPRKILCPTDMPLSVYSIGSCNIDYLGIKVFYTSYTDDIDCVAKINRMVRQYMVILSNTCEFEAQLLPYTIGSRYDAKNSPTYASCMLCNVTNYLMGTIRRNGEYQYSILFDSSGHSIRSINRINAVPVIYRMINNNSKVKEVSAKANKFSVENSIVEKRTDYKRLLAQKYRRTLAKKINSIIEKIINHCIQNLSDPRVTTLYNMKASLVVLYKKVRIRSLLCKVDLYYDDTPKLSRILVIKLYDYSNSNKVSKDRALTKVIESFIVDPKSGEDKFSCIDNLAEFAAHKDDPNYNQLVKSYRHMPITIKGAIQYIQSNHDTDIVLRSMFIELIEAYHQCNQSLASDSDIYSKKDELDKLNRQKSQILEKDVRFQKRILINDLTIDMIDSSIGNFLTQLNYYCESDITGEMLYKDE